MRVQMHRMITGSIGHFEAGTIADLPDDMAVALIACGAASPVGAPEIQTAAIAPAETAVTRKPVKRTGR